uniref:hypothetical protein n=1 Tax=Nonomuraea gerenzanensis TaxID=93944 RepID=UPI00287F428A|nr:hypothetical protein [Nonomuraea gerenzanensis]
MGGTRGGSSRTAQAPILTVAASQGGPAAGNRPGRAGAARPRASPRSWADRASQISRNASTNTVPSRLTPMANGTKLTQIAASNAVRRMSASGTTSMPAPYPTVSRRHRPSRHCATHTSTHHTASATAARTSRSRTGAPSSSAT